MDLLLCILSTLYSSSWKSTLGAPPHPPTCFFFFEDDVVFFFEDDDAVVFFFEDVVVFFFEDDVVVFFFLGVVSLKREAISFFKAVSESLRVIFFSIYTRYIILDYSINQDAQKNFL